MWDKSADIFEDEEDKQKNIETFARYKGRNCYTLFVYYLMNNYIHILLEEQEELISMKIKRIYYYCY